MNAGRAIDRSDWPAPPPGVRVVTDREELRHFYCDRVAAHVYALADLDEPFWSASRWYRRDDAVVGLVGLPSGDGLACYAVATRDPDATLGLLTALAPHLPGGLLITGPVGTADALRRVRALAWDGPHLRYELVEPTAVPPVDKCCEPLGPHDADELQALYDTEPAAAFFLPHMLSDETYVGVRDDGRLVAAAGTHVCATGTAAAIGAVYTHPAHRRRGLARVVTAGVVHRIGARVGVIGLNVATDNAPARHVYERLGFAPILPYEEAELA